MDRPSPSVEEPHQRRVCWIEGIVQGVGFRPFVHRLATNLGLAGFVRNQSGMVYLEAEGPAGLLDQFAQEIASNPPRSSSIQSIHWLPGRPERITGFRIEESIANDVTQVFVSPDLATCDDCLRELLDPTDRRYRYPFINCMNCGPRLTIIRAAPYDRQRTTMAAFRMCRDCQQEYDDPHDRRFHAQPIACPACGPRLQLRTNKGSVINCTDPLDAFISAILEGKIGALKGLGGYHVVCDALNEMTVNELRRRKHREQKPLAIMAANLDHVRAICAISDDEAKLLGSIRRPIVVLPRRTDAGGLAVAAAIAPRIARLGVMLPYTPLHHLLMQRVGDHPLVMTSGNQSDEPMACDDADAIDRLQSIVDLMLTHDRPICVRCDDSVTCMVSGRESPIRRARGDAPFPVTLPQPLRQPTLAVGGQLKSTFALGRDRLAFLSQHLGDLNHVSAYQAFQRDVGLYENLLGIRPERIVHDLHPDYASSHFAQQRAQKLNVPRLAVQHHHAHLASCMAEHGLTGTVIGVTFDGTGYGTDGTIWGGEFLIGSYSGFHRAAYLRPVGLPGGDAAIREPWRCAVAQLRAAGLDARPYIPQIPASSIETIEQMLDKEFRCPRTSSMGRLFDAVAALAGICNHVAYEGQAAMELESLAMTESPIDPYPFEFNCIPGGELPQWIIETRPLIDAIVADRSAQRSAAVIARRFQSTVVRMVVEVCRTLQTQWPLDQVALTGGVFMNSLLLHECIRELTAAGFRVHWQQRVPCNDGGLSLGQLAVAAVCDFVG